MATIAKLIFYELVLRDMGGLHFQLSTTDNEMLWNGPQQWLPDNGVKPSKGILLVHGLGDSPWTFHDIAPRLAEQGFLVRTILLPGHGTDPAELLETTAEEWQKIVHEQAQALRMDVEGEVFLGGFSTGANLVLDYAYQHSEIAGLVFFSPGFKSMPFDWLAPLVAKIRPWVIPPSEGIPTQSLVRYMNVPINGYAQFYRTSATAQELLKHPYDKPVFLAVAEHDSVINTNYLVEVFQQRFTHPNSRMIWYGKQSEAINDFDRTYIKEDYMPEYNISQFSHMGLLFSPDNPLYGINGSLPICLNGMDGEQRKACEDGKDELWYSAWGYTEEGKVHARLTFNPYFNWQIDVMTEVLNSKAITTKSQQTDSN